jgi:hypothetical protein
MISKEVMKMKNDLICQSSEYDCGPTCLTNALRYLYERKEILPGLLKQIWLVGNDTYCEKGCVGCRGTSKAAMRYMADWFNCYAKGWRFPIGAEFLENEQADITPDGRAWQCLQKGGCAVMRCLSGGIGHYVLLTAILPEGKSACSTPMRRNRISRSRAAGWFTANPRNITGPCGMTC